MIQYIKGNLLESPAQVLVNTVNTQGVMGKGIALSFKNEYPKMFDEYKGLCDEKKLQVGNLYMYRSGDRWILLFPTKQEWRKQSKIEYLEKGLYKFCSSWDKLGGVSYAFPPLGCGNGGLAWSEVKPLMEKYLKPLPLLIYIYSDYYQDSNSGKKVQLSELDKCILDMDKSTEYEFFLKCLKKFLDENPSEGLLSDDSFQKGNIIMADSEISRMWYSLKERNFLTDEQISEENGWRCLLDVMVNMGCAGRVFLASDDVDYPERPNAFQYKRMAV